MRGSATVAHTAMTVVAVLLLFLGGTFATNRSQELEIVATCAVNDNEIHVRCREVGTMSVTDGFFEFKCLSAADGPCHFNGDYSYKPELDVYWTTELGWYWVICNMTTDDNVVIQEITMCSLPYVSYVFITMAIFLFIIIALFGCMWYLEEVHIQYVKKAHIVATTTAGP